MTVFGIIFGTNFPYLCKLNLLVFSEKQDSNVSGVVKGRNRPRVFWRKTSNFKFCEIGILMTCTAESPTRRNSFLDLKTRTDFTNNLRHIQKSRKRNENIYGTKYSRMDEKAIFHKFCLVHS